MLFICSIVVLVLAEWTKGQSWSGGYERFSQDHSFNLEPNPTCNIIARGINGEEDKILNLHNKFRNKVALGNEKQAGGLPPASNMMQMFWDPELAAIAQKWAEHCKYGHDCNECRAVNNFAVGENIFKSWYTCTQNPCNTTFDWEGNIQSFYDEVQNFDNRDVEKFGPPPSGKTTGHFTQLIWAESWRVGCGLVVFQEGQLVTMFSVCNYGPAGNHGTGPIYIPGETCSNCPINTCCGSECSEFEGLCKMENKNEAPIYPISTTGLLFYCNFTTSNEDCEFNKVTREGAVFKDTLMGKTLTLELEGGEEIEIGFAKTIHPTSNFCFRPRFRQGPAVAGDENLSNFEADFVLDGSNYKINLNYPSNNYVPEDVGLFKATDVTFSLKFSVPAGAGKYIVDILDIVIFDGDCVKK